MFIAGCWLEASLRRSKAESASATARSPARRLGPQKAGLPSVSIISIFEFSI